MPTGTGKSGVIAVLCKSFDDIPSALVVTPWSVLRRQIAYDISQRFWKRINVQSPGPGKPVIQLFPRSASNLLRKARPQGAVYVCTIQTLQKLESKSKSAYNLLRHRATIVIVDEGHREPAPEWAAAVRGLRRPTVLLTATPYRNDHKLFNVDPKFVFAYPHHRAVEKRFIRDVRFVKRNFADWAAEFVDELIHFYEGDFQRLRPPDIKTPRVIVRCNSSNAINDIANRLKEKNQSVIAIHDRFSGRGTDFRRKHVPSPENHDAIFWVHQNKLIEGIDDPSFCLLAIYEPLRNARAFVQQVGRIIRNPHLLRDQVAFVFTDPRHHQDAYWQAYLDYEEGFEASPERYDPRGIFDNTVGLQPAYEYLEGNFRSRLDFDVSELFRRLRYRLSTNLFETTGKFSMRQFSRAVREEWIGADRDIRYSEFPDEKTWVFVYVTYQNSPILLRDALLQYELGFTISRQIGKYVAFYDSQGVIPEILVNSARRVSPDQLQSLFGGSNARLTAISLVNTDLGRYSIRRREFQAYSIANTAPGLVDHAQFVSTARGYDSADGGTIPRYVGVTRSRVSDYSAPFKEYDDYVQWLDTLVYELQRRKQTLSLFDRFARFAEPPRDTTPTNILLDIDDVLSSFETASHKNGERGLLQLDELCYDIEHGNFRCLANSSTFTVSVAYDPGRQTYRLSSHGLEKAYVRRDSSRGKVQDTLIGYLNRHQTFRIIPKTPGVIYAHSRFYESNLPLWGKVRPDRFDLLSILRPVAVLSQIRSEKGQRCAPNESRWQQGSLFHLVDTFGVGTELESELNAVDILVCDDMGTEVADFIAISTHQRRAIFIHAKAFDPPSKRAASSLQEVSAQAIKNLEYLNPYSRMKPPKLRQWDGPWVGGPIGTVRRRVRKGRGDAQAIWEKITNVIRDPSASREVWILLGQGLSREDFERQRNSPTPAPEIVQIIYLLHSTWSAISSSGASIRIYCSP